MNIELGHGTFTIDQQKLGSTLREFDALLSALHVHQHSLKN